MTFFVHETQTDGKETLKLIQTNSFFFLERGRAESRERLRARLMVEGEESGWLSELEKKGLHQVTEILENYGMNNETDVSVFDRDDFCKLVSRGLKPLEAKKLQRWCDAVCARAENMFPSSLNTPAGAHYSVPKH
jgi:hypothetical protein